MTRLLVTGATGFIGGRVAERAVTCGWSVVAPVRRWSRAARLARLPVEMIAGDVLDRHALTRAMAGCDLVVHCAVDNEASGRAHQSVSIDGTANVMAAAATCGVSRVIHLSSTAVFGYRPTGHIEESTPLRPTGDDYCDGKIGAERAALGSDAPVVILRPTIVYGPFGSYSRDVTALYRQGRLALVDGGHGVCNTLYVDNLVDAIFAAASAGSAVGEVFHVSDAAAVTWRRFLEGHAYAVDAEAALPTLSSHQIAIARRADRTSTARRVMNLAGEPVVRDHLRDVRAVAAALRLTRTVAGRVLPTPTRHRLRSRIHPPTAPGEVRPAALNEGEVLMISAFQDVIFGIEKASEILRYAPAIDFDEGMRRTGAWLRWARL